MEMSYCIRRPLKKYKPVRGLSFTTPLIPFSISIFNLHNIQAVILSTLLSNTTPMQILE